MTSKKTIKIAYSGITDSLNIKSKNELILRIIESKSDAVVVIVDKIKYADMILAYPYGSGSTIFKFKWVLFQVFKKIMKVKDNTRGFRWILGVGSKPTLFISHENLDRPYWWRIYGSLIIESKIPRMTYWPNSIDADGVRFPYWYNYVDWEDYPRPNFYARYGRLYSIEVLMSPIKEDYEKLDEAILIASKIDLPRSSILKELKINKIIKIFGKAGTPFKGGKYLLMKKFKYAICCENSIGFGYDSEKIPEAWIAGCIPCGVYLNPLTDFNPKVLSGFECEDKHAAYDSPLLLNKPNLIEIEEYVKKFIDQHCLGNADLSR